MHISKNNNEDEMPYKAPIDDIKHCLNNIIGIEKLYQTEAYSDFDEDVSNQILEEAGKFTENLIAPTNKIGDKIGIKFDQDKGVIVPDFVREINQKYAEAGWQAIKIPSEFGGMGLPNVLGLAVSEMMHSSNMAYALKPMLSAGTILAISKHGTQAQIEEYLPNLVDCTWAGTMNLTEPHAGSDVGALTTKAIPQGDGTYKIYGQKIFITWGDHDLNDNIIHLVLARLPDAPSGARGISLFIVPKFLKNEAGEYVIRNDAGAIGIEHKLGIHLSPTCVMGYGEGLFGDEKGAIGYLLGEENKGLACMFTMMNEARLDVGLQGVGIAEAATQHAFNYAIERRQGRTFDETEKGSSLIIKHPDVKRMLVDMTAKTQMSRAICYQTAFASDMVRIDKDNSKYWHALEGFLTPIAKAYSTDIGVNVASQGVQIHGGMGFIEETGAAQYYRDARIAPIYEGTNAIQANDLIGRKLLSDNGTIANSLCDEIINFCSLNNNSELDFTNLSNSASVIKEISQIIIEWQKNDMQFNALANATNYLNLWGDLLGAFYIAKGFICLSKEQINYNNQYNIYSYINDNILANHTNMAANFKKLPESIDRYEFKY